MSIREHMAQRLQEFRQAKGLSVNEVGEAVGRSGKTVSSWEVGRGQPDADMLIKLCRLYGARISDFYEDAVPAVSVGFYEVPLYGSISAGTPIEMIPVEEGFPIPSEMCSRYPKAFLLKVKGNSMNRRIPNGCYALVDPTQVDVVDGKPYAVCVNGYEATIKRVVKLANGIELDPDSTDPTYHPVVYDYGKEDTEEITIIGRVVWITMPYNYEL